MAIALNEQETVIQFSRDTEEATVWTSDKTVMTKLDKFCEQSDAYSLVEEDVLKLTGKVFSKKYRVADKSLISFRKNKSKREMTPEQRAELAERMRNARAKKAGNEGVSDW